MDEAGLYDEKGNRMARPSDAEVARYSNNAYNQAAGQSRREFLRYAGAVAAGAAFGLPLVNCGKTPTEPSKIYTIQGNVIGTFGRQPMNIGQASAGAIAGTINGSSFEIKDVPPGYHNISVDGGGVQTRRVRNNISVGGDMTLNFDAIESGYPLNIENYRTMAMGLNTPTPPANPGKSKRFRPGINPRLIIVRHSGISDAYYNAAIGAGSFFPTITGGILASAPYEFVDTEPTSNIPEGSIIVVFYNGGFVTNNNSDGFYITNSKVYAPVGEVGDGSGVAVTFIHEIAGHSLGLDHSNDQNSIMRATSLAGHSGVPTQNDMDAGFLKYRRLGGHELSAAEDKD